ncbi:hypothetical protein ACQP2F_00150 [Actinoplanes sp. CA-030573]|uniref:hypothetical protein n=1 Tax=Actinoplanes sp. CA-030573 TaxID=3239898 RepID=UPI003D8B8CBC
MTGLGVERVARAACPPPSVRPTDVSPSLPPLIQKAERRRSRWGLRLLVVGGLAGAAWLLTGAAAHAADRSDEPTGSLLGAVVGSDATAPVSGLLTAAAQPLEAVPAHHKHDVVADLLDVPKRVLTRPVETVGKVAHGSTGTTVDAATGGVDAVLREVAGPLRLTGGPTDTPQRIIAAVTDKAVIPGVERPEPAVAPQLQLAPDAPVAPAGTDAAEVAPAPVATANRTTLSTALRAPIAGAVRAGAVARHVKAAPHHIARRHRTTASAAATEQASAGGDAPGGDGSASWQLHLGDVSGTSTSGSGTPTEGGSAAFLPAAIVNSAMACHRLPIVSDVEVRRHDAEAPTVSPD